VDYDEHISAVERELEALVDALAPERMTSPVPSCPEWTVADLAQHVGEFCGFWSHVICEATGRSKPEIAEMPAASGIADWVMQAGNILVTELRATDSNQPMWSWVRGEGHAAFAARRAANELAIHRYDAQLASGTNLAIDGSLAVDGIDEIFVMARAWSAEDDQFGTGTGQSLLLEAIDQNAVWRIELTPTGTQVLRSKVTADLTLHAGASDLELLLYSRPTIGPIDQVGDESVLMAWHSAYQFE
jgi:uncharacterized protein (TIGR03083 family)